MVAIRGRTEASGLLWRLLLLLFGVCRDASAMMVFQVLDPSFVLEQSDTALEVAAETKWCIFDNNF